MVSSCSAYGCTNRFSKEKKLVFHRFPLDNPELLKKWLIAVRRASWQPSKYSRLCSDHFTVESYKSEAKCYLKNDAVPSIFNFSPHVRKNARAQRVTTEHKLPVQQCESLQVTLDDPDMCGIVQNHTEDSQNEIENVHQNISKTSLVNHPLSSACNFKSLPDNLNSSNKNKYLLHTQSRTVPMPSSLSHATCFQNHATSSAAKKELPPVESTKDCWKISSNGARCKRIVVVPNSKYRESVRANKLLQRKIKSLREAVRRRDMKIRRLEAVIAQAKKIAEMSYQTVHVLPNTVGSVPVELIVDELNKSSVKPLGQTNSSQFILKERLWQSKARRKI